MMTFNKLALATAVAALSTTSFAALQQVDDSQLGAVTGQEGITVSISPDANGMKIKQVFIHDNDGVGSGNHGVTTSSAGAIVIGDGTNDGVTIKGGKIELAIDADGNAAKPVLNVNAKLNASSTGYTEISLGQVSVGQSGTAPDLTSTTATIRRGATNNAKILNGLDVKLGTTSMNIQLGNQPQGALVVMNSTMTGGLKLDNLELVDADGGTTTPAAEGVVKVDSLKVTDANNANMSMNGNINIDSVNGLEVTMTNNLDLYVKGVHLGTATAPSIGDIEVNGLNMGTSTISIKGH